MIIYRAYLDYGSRLRVLGYFESISGAYACIVKNSEKKSYYLGHLKRESSRDTYPILYSDGSPTPYHYVIERIEVQP